MPTLPPLPQTLPGPPTGLLVIFSPATFAWIAESLSLIYRAQRETTQDSKTRLDLIIAALGPLTSTLEHLMATVAELQSALDANTAATEAAVASITTEIAQLQAAIDALAAAAPADLQPQVDQVNAATAKLTAAVSALAADDPAAPEV